MLSDIEDRILDIIRLRIEFCGLSQRQVAFALGIDPSNFSKFLRGKLNISYRIYNDLLFLLHMKIYPEAVDGINSDEVRSNVLQVIALNLSVKSNTFHCNVAACN